jgi:hypothetical protein
MQKRGVIIFFSLCSLLFVVSLLNRIVAVKACDPGFRHPFVGLVGPDSYRDVMLSTDAMKEEL